MKIKKETLSQTIKCSDTVGALKESFTAITNSQANSLSLMSEVLGATDTVAINTYKVVTDPVSVLKTHNAACDNSQGSWQHDGILRQALLSRINSSQTEKSNISMSVDSALPKLQDTILSSVANVKLSEDMPPVSLSTTTLSQDSFSPNEFSSTITSATLPFTSLSLDTLPSNNLSSECAIPAQEPTLPIINQIPSCDVHQPPLHSESCEILSDTSNHTISNPGINSSETATNVECISSPLISAVPSYPVAQSNLVCQAFASLSSKDNSVTVVCSAVPKAESSSHLIQKTVPLPSMSEVKSSLSNSINTLPSAQNKTTNDIRNKVSLALSGISSNTNPTLGFDSISSNGVDGSLGTIKLDEQSNSADFNGESSISSDAVKFSTDTVASDIPSRIVIPVSSDVILTKINGPNPSSHQDISHIITIPLPAGTIYNSSLIPMPLSLPNNIPPGSSVPMTPTIVSNLPYSLAGIANPVSNQCWPSSGITLSVTNTSNSQISTSVTSSLPVSIMSVAPPITSLPNSNLVHFASNTLPTSQVTTIRTIPQDPVCYTVQSPAEILSQLSKAGVFPTMSSSQVSSVLSALGSDSHVDLESDTTHNEILNSQVLSNEKVSTLTQTDSLEMNIMQQEEKIIQLLGGQQLLEHSINGSQMIMPSSNQTPDINSDGALNNDELVVENVPERKRVNSPFPRIVAMVLNAPSISNEKLPLTNINNNGVLRNCENKEPAYAESHSEHLSDSPSDSLREFLVPPSNTKPQRKRQKKTSALREMLLGVCNTSSGTDNPSKKSRGKSKKVNNGSTLSPESTLKISETVSQGDIGISLEIVKDNSRYTKEAECYKCKSCPFLSLEETSMLQHIKEKHCSEEQQLSIMRQELKCPGCANVFFTVKSLEVHLKQDHQVNTPELKAITSSAIRIAMEGSVKSPQTKKKKKKPSCKSEGKINVNSNGENTVHCNGNISNTAGSSSCIIPTIPSRGALIFSTNNNSESEILTSDQKICVKDLPNGNTMSTIDKSVISFKNILISSSKEGESLGSQEQSGNGFNGTTWNQLNEGVVNNALPLTKGEKFSESKTDEKVNVVAQKKRKRGRPKGSKSSTLIAGMMGDKDDGQSPKKTNSGHRCNVDDCAVTMRSPENIEYHRSCHNGPEFRCPECAHTHCHWNGLSTHLWRVHMVDMELYTCDQCNYKNVSYAKLVNLHKRIHGSERPFLCDSCGKGFKNRKQLRNHKSIHQPKQTKLGECEICGRTFNSSRMLRTHLDNVHNKLRPHLCNYCGYSASSVGSLKMHMRKHTGEKPFRCNLCDYCTADHNSLRRHKMRHTGDKPYKCPHCPYACIQSSTYKAHLKTKHPGMDDGLMFSCNICSFRSVKEENYIAHLAEHKRHIKSLPGKVNRQEKDVVPDKLDVEEQSGSVIELVEHLENGTSERFSMEKLGGLDSICDVQMTLESDFETEEITGDISEAELITGDLGEPQDFKICENELKIKSHNEDLHTAAL